MDDMFVGYVWVWCFLFFVFLPELKAKCVVSSRKKRSYIV